MKKILILVLLLFSLNIIAEELMVNIDENRFFGAKGTELQINYQVPYSSLQFVQNEYGFLAELEVKILITAAGKELYNKSFKNNIIVTNQVRTHTDESFIDKIALTLNKSGYDIQLTFLNGQKQKVWDYTFQTLSADALISDLELSSQVKTDTSDFMQKFHRENKLFMVKPSHIFDKNSADNIFVYYQLQNLFSNENGEYDITETLKLYKKDDLVWENSNTEKLINGDKMEHIKKISLTDLEDGFYKIVVEITDNTTGIKQTREDFLSIKTKVHNYPRLFTNWEDDFQILRYFLQSSEYRRFQNLSENAKKNYVERFWNSQDPNPTTEENEFLELMRKRINYVNRYYSHFQDGWETDVGRIYIKNGAPHSIEKGTTGVLTAYASRDYEIWKYRGQLNRTYLFLDLQSTGQFRLIYCEGDDDEESLPQWESYMGEDFDTSELQ